MKTRGHLMGVSLHSERNGLNRRTPSAVWHGRRRWNDHNPGLFGGTQLDATSLLAGMFVYSPAAGKVLAIGSHTLSVKFTPTNNLREKLTYASQDVGQKTRV